MGYPKNDRCTSFFGISQDYLAKRFVWDIPKQGNVLQRWDIPKYSEFGISQKHISGRFWGWIWTGKKKGGTFLKHEVPLKD